jgi:hypothetical protein
VATEHGALSPWAGALRKEKTVMSSLINRPTFQARLTRVIEGIGKRLQNVPSLVLAGVTYTPTELITFFQSGIDAVNTVTSTKTKWQDAVKAEHDLLKRIHVAELGLKSHLENLYGNASEPLAAFGMKPRKVRSKPTGQATVQAAAKARLTREARHTLGAKKRAQVKGTVEVPAASVSASPAPSPVAAPTGSHSSP